MIQDGIKETQSINIGGGGGVPAVPPLYPYKIMTFAPVKIAPMINADIKHNSNPNPNPYPNPNPNLNSYLTPNQKPNHYPHSLCWRYHCRSNRGSKCQITTCTCSSADVRLGKALYPHWLVHLRGFKAISSQFYLFILFCFTSSFRA